MPLSGATLEKAKRELNENPDKRSKDIQVLRDMVLANPGLKCPTDDAFLLKFLRARKFNYDRAYNLIVDYYTIRTENIIIFQECLPSKIPLVLDCKVSMMLPNRDKEGRRIFYFRPGNWDFTKFPMIDILKLNTMQMEKVITEEETQVHGVIAIGNFGGLTMGHVKHFDKEFARLMSSFMQDAFPMRAKALHICNQPSIFSYIWAIIKPFMKEKMSKRINFHGTDLTALQEAIGKDNLPEELGGHLGSADKIAEAWYEEMKADEAKYKDMLQYKIELSRTITSKKNEDVVDSLIGTYRKLNVD